MRPLQWRAGQHTPNVQGYLAYKKTQTPGSGISEVSAGGSQHMVAVLAVIEIQGHLAHKKVHPPRTLQQACDWSPTVMSGGGQFRMGEVQGYLAHKKSPPPLGTP